MRGPTAQDTPTGDRAERHQSADQFFTSGWEGTGRVGGEIFDVANLDQPRLAQDPQVSGQEAQRRVYGLRPEPLAEVDEWLGRYRALWEQRLDALRTEVARGKRERRSSR